MDEKSVKNPRMPQGQVSFLALGGIEDVTRNMYLYEYKNQILIVDCGLGFPDETMLGVDLLLPDISYLLEVIKKGKKIVGMVLTHGHEDHIGGLPFILPQLPSFPIYASALTAALSNDKLAEYHLPRSVKTVSFDDGDVRIGDFAVSFIRVTHSVPDSANFFIKTPAGNFFHGSDFKFDLSPADGKRTEFVKIMKSAEEGVLSLMSDCLGADRAGHTRSEEGLIQNFEREMHDCQGKFIITTYSSNVARLNQAIKAAESVNRKVCFVGRSIIKVKQLAQQMGYLQIRGGTEAQLSDVKRFKNSQLVLLVAGSQGQENSAMTRIANGEHKDIRIDPLDVVVFSSDTIPGNELTVNALIDAISKKGARAISGNGQEAFHVSGHGSSGDHMLLIALTKPKFLVPISGTYRNMVAYKTLAQKMGYNRSNTFLIDNGQQIDFSASTAKLGKKIDTKNIYVDEVSGEEVENFVIRDRERLAKEGVVIVMTEVKSSDGQLADKPVVIARGSSIQDTQNFSASLQAELEKNLALQKSRVTNWVHIRRVIGDTAERHIFKKFHIRPLVLPVVIEV